MKYLPVMWPACHITLSLNWMTFIFKLHYYATATMGRQGFEYFILLTDRNCLNIFFCSFISFLPQTKITAGLSPLRILGRYKTICLHIELAGNDTTLIPEPVYWILSFPCLDWNPQLSRGLSQLAALRCLEHIKEQLYSTWCPLED